MIETSIKLFLVFILCLSITSCNKNKSSETIYISEDLQLTKINDHSYIHVSAITLESGAIYPCNGFIYVNNNEAYVFDTPANDRATAELIDWLQNDQKVIIKGVVFNHFHRDCIEGMDVFKSNNILCIASKKTASYMQKQKYESPDQVFENDLELKLGDKNIINTYFGEAHTSDNIVSYFPEENLMYGGCMIKSLTAKKGNLADANTNEWSKTVSKIKKTYPNIKIVIPGHGEYGDVKLLDYTISLFQTKK